MRYVIARYNYEMRDMMYRFYITDELFYLNNNVVNMTGGTQLRMRLDDLYHPQPEETRTSEEIIESLKAKLKEI